MGRAHQAVLGFELHAGLHEATLVVIGLDAAEALGMDLVDRQMKVKVAGIEMRGGQLRIPTKSPAYSDFNAPMIPILIRPPFRDIPAHFLGLADEQS
jgi:hypothetical protein